MSVVAQPGILSMPGSRDILPANDEEQGGPSQPSSSSNIGSRRSSAATSTDSRSGRPTSAQDLQVFDYNLVVRQQPKQARICNGTDKQPKGPVDPPPVVRLQISRGSGNTASSSSSDHEANQTSLTSASLIQSPYLFCFAALCKTDSEEEVYLGQDGRTKIVTGNVVSSLYHLRDPKDGSAEGFFVFPDIGVRSEGTFRLKFSLYEMVDSTVFHCKTIFTEVFEVYSAKRYPGTEDSTELSKSFASQGLKMRIKGSSARAAGKLPADPLARSADNLLPTNVFRLDAPAKGLPAKRPATADMQAKEPEHVKRRALDMNENSQYYHQPRPPYRSYEPPVHYTDPHQPQAPLPRLQTQYPPDDRPRSRDFAVRPPSYGPLSSYGNASRPSTAPALPLTPVYSSQHPDHEVPTDWSNPSLHRNGSQYSQMRPPPPPRQAPFPPTVIRSYSDYRPRSSTESYRDAPVYHHPPPPSRLPFASSLRSRPGSSGGMFKLPSLAEVVPAEECLPPPRSRSPYPSERASPPLAGELPRPQARTASSLHSILNPYEVDQRRLTPPENTSDEDSRYFANKAKVADSRRSSQQEEADIVREDASMGAE